MRILITGANSFIGARLVYLAALQHIEVVALTRSGICPKGALKSFAWSLGESLPDNAYVGVNCAVHLAYDFNGLSGSDCTAKSTISIASQLELNGVKRQIFFSSYSSSEDALSLYGQTKFHIEKALVVNSGITVVRPGLVLGEAGIYGRIRKWAQLLPIVPLPDGGRGKVPVIELDMLCNLTIQLILDNSNVKYANFFEPELRSLRELVLDAANEVGRNPWILPVPPTILIYILKLFEKTCIPMPIIADNLIGFISNQTVRHNSSLQTRVTKND